MYAMLYAVTWQTMQLTAIRLSYGVVMYEVIVLHMTYSLSCAFDAAMRKCIPNLESSEAMDPPGTNSKKIFRVLSVLSVP